MISIEKDKYFDNKLAEEFDIIVLTNGEHERKGFPRGSVGALTRSYTGKGRPLYAIFTDGDGNAREEALALNDFRVLNENSRYDLPLIFRFYRKEKSGS